MNMRRMVTVLTLRNLSASTFAAGPTGNGGGSNLASFSIVQLY